MKRFAPALGLALCCTAAFAQSGMQQGPTVDQARTALQNAMNREIQTMKTDPQPGFDGPEAVNVVNSLQVRDVVNCKPTAQQSMACDVSTTANVRGSREEHTNRYDFYMEAGRWQARLP
jgi:hypothetical protein